MWSFQLHVGHCISYFKVVLAFNDRAHSFTDSPNFPKIKFMSGGLILWYNIWIKVWWQPIAGNIKKVPFLIQIRNARINIVHLFIYLFIFLIKCILIKISSHIFVYFAKFLYGFFWIDNVVHLKTLTLILHIKLISISKCKLLKDILILVAELWYHSLVKKNSNITHYYNSSSSYLDSQ